MQHLLQPLEPPGEEAVMRREGDRLVVEPTAPSGPNARLLAVLAALEPLGPKDAFPLIVDRPPGVIDL